MKKNNASLHALLGEKKPRFDLRPLWIRGECEVALTSNVTVTVPQFMVSDKKQPIAHRDLELFCERLLELGYNSILLGHRKGTFVSTISSSEATIDFDAICSVFHDYQIKVILKAQIYFSPAQRQFVRSALDPTYHAFIQSTLQTLIKSVPHIDYLFWEGDPTQHTFARNTPAFEATGFERLCAEVKLVEESLNGLPLIYFLPTTDRQQATQHATWLADLCDEAGQTTVLAYSALAGDPWLDHLSTHPFWQVLQNKSAVSYTPLMPILNIGGVSQGEGLWPVLTMDLLEDYISRCTHHCFAGAISLVNHLPASGTFLDCNLWVTSQVLWRECSALISTETWFSTFRPDLDFNQLLPVLRKVREIAIELSFLRALKNEGHRDLISSEECRLIAESLLANLKYLQLRLTRDAGVALKKERPHFFDYFTCFVRDARRIIGHFLQCFNQSLPEALLGKDDVQEGFWTAPPKGAFLGKTSDGKLAFLDVPQRGNAGSVMAQIFDENRRY